MISSPAALKAGAGLAVVARAIADSFADDAPLLVVPDVLDGLRDLARAARARSQAQIIAVTGSVGKTSTKEALRLALSRDGETHASVASYNNHWGVPLSLARCPQSARYAVFEIGMNHAGEIAPLTRLVRPHVAIITTIEPVHLEYLRLDRGDRRRQGGNLPRARAGRRGDHQPRQPAVRAACERARRMPTSRVVSFGEHAEADARLINCALQPDSSTVQANILGHDVTYKLGAPGRHLVMQFARRAGGGGRSPAPIWRSRRWRSASCSRRPAAARASPSTCRAARHC